MIARMAGVASRAGWFAMPTTNSGFLALTRGVGQSFFIGEDIEVYVTRIDRRQVKFGIRAPKHIQIRRAEVPAEDKQHD